METLKHEVKRISYISNKPNSTDDSSTTVAVILLCTSLFGHYSSIGVGMDERIRLAGHCREVFLDLTTRVITVLYCQKELCLWCCVSYAVLTANTSLSPS